MYAHMSNKQSKPNEIGAVQKSLELIETLKILNGGRVTELADRLDWPKSTVHSHLGTLESVGYVVKEGDIYQLGFRFVDLGEYVKNKKQVYSIVEPRIHTLAEKTGERVQFVINEHGDCVYARIAKGEQAVSTGSSLGRRRHMLHATAAGKSILAFTEREQINNTLDLDSLPQLTENTITDQKKLFEELERVSDRGFAFNHEEHIEGLRAVAAPVREQHGAVIGSVSVSGPAHRLQGEYFNKELPEIILGVCNEIELDMMYQ